VLGRSQAAGALATVTRAPLFGLFLPLKNSWCCAISSLAAARAEPLADLAYESHL
jgi:hypothetical protein